MIKENNERITITLSKKQINWLQEQAEKLHITVSKFISWMLVKKASEITEYQQLMNEEIDYSDLIKIIKTPWIQ